MRMAFKVEKIEIFNLQHCFDANNYTIIKAVYIKIAKPKNNQKLTSNGYFNSFIETSKLILVCFSV